MINKFEKCGGVFYKIQKFSFWICLLVLIFLSVLVGMSKNSPNMLNITAYVLIFTLSIFLISDFILKIYLAYFKNKKVLLVFFILNSLLSVGTSGYGCYISAEGWLAMIWIVTPLFITFILSLVIRNI